mmetsp:Transcript_7206/g.14432  ORF Transcript_7206/g.14432 Transcript_7206/m.14432 type:complete len:587 (-) Transcript_7206:1374-3134(-)
MAPGGGDDGPAGLQGTAYQASGGLDARNEAIDGNIGDGSGARGGEGDDMNAVENVAENSDSSEEAWRWLDDHHDATGAVAGALLALDEEEDASAPARIRRQRRSRLESVASEGSRHMSPLFVGFTLVMSVVGTGLLSLPSAFQCMGIGPGLLVLVFVSVFMFFTGDLFVRSYLVSSPNVNESYEGMALQACKVTSQSWLAQSQEPVRWIVNLTNAMGLFGGCCAYIAIGKEIWPDLEARISGRDPEVPGIIPWYASTEVVTGAMVLLVSLPLCLRRKLSSLRYSSTLGFCFSIFMIIIVSSRGIRAMVEGHGKQPDAWHPACPEEPLWNGLVLGLSIFNFSFVFHFNSIPLFKSLPDHHRNLKTMRVITAGSIATCFAIYSLLGIAGFALFGADVEGNILNNFAPDDDGINTARAAIAACCYLCLPLLEHPLRGTVLTMFKLSHGRRVRLLVTVALLTAQYLIALVVPSIKIVFTVTGGGAVVGFCYIFPTCIGLVTLWPSSVKRIVQHQQIAQQVLHQHQQDLCQERASDASLRIPLLSDPIPSFSEKSIYALSRFEVVICAFVLAFFPITGLWSVYISLHNVTN